MRLLLLGHSGFLGRRFLEFLKREYKDIRVVGISREISYDLIGIHLEQYTSLKEFKGNGFDYIFNFTHSQSADDVCVAERSLAREIISFIKDNGIVAPVVLIKSVGNGSEHIRSRTAFNDMLKRELTNEIFEVRSSVISEPGSVSYEIPYRIVKKINVIPRFPWMDNSVSLIKAEDILKVFKNIIDKKTKERLLTPEHRTVTYADYVIEIAEKEGRQIRFVSVGFNDFLITPLIVSFITGLNTNLVKHLMRTLNEDAVL